MAERQELLRLLSRGDDSAIQQVLNEHRSQLTKMVRARMDARVTARFDPSDVVQDALMQAFQRLPQYLASPDVPFYIWLRRLTWERLVQLHRQHMGAEKRSVTRESRRSNLNDESENLLAKRLASNFSGPAEHAVHCETRRRVRAALQLLSDRDREILELRYVDQMDPQEIASALGIGRGTVGTRHFRAIQRLKKLLEVE